MDSSELLSAFRTELYDLPHDIEAQGPQLWEDDEIYGYIDEAQKLFCRLVGGIGDGSSPLTQLSIAPVSVTDPTTHVVTTTPASDWVTVSPLILKFRDAYTGVEARPVEIVNYEDMPTHGIRFNGRTSRRPEALVIGIEPGRARIYPAPTLESTGVIQLIVDRLPLKSINDSDQKLEIGEMHHINLLMWMKHRAYSKQDADTYDAKKANDFDAEFRTYCEMAKREKERAKSKVRIVAYGGIGGANGRSYHHNRGYSCRY